MKSCDRDLPERSIAEWILLTFCYELQHKSISLLRSLASERSPRQLQIIVLNNFLVFFEFDFLQRFTPP